jgi:hypothetical protein
MSHIYPRKSFITLGPQVFLTKNFGVDLLNLFSKLDCFIIAVAFLSMGIPVLIMTVSFFCENFVDNLKLNNCYLQTYPFLKVFFYLTQPRLERLYSRNFFTNFLRSFLAKGALSLV